MKFPYQFHSEVVFRTPTFPLSTAATAEQVLTFFATPAGQEALYLASPTLHTEYLRLSTSTIKKESTEYQNILLSLTKYYYRAHTRCTPFGLFAAVGATQFAPQATTTVQLTQRQRLSRLDMVYLGQLGRYLEQQPKLKNQLAFSPNSSIYTIGDEIRYVESIYDATGKKTHRISAVTQQDYLLEIFRFTRKGKLISEIANYLVNEYITLPTARRFVQQLIDSQLLVSELAPSVTGEDYFTRLWKIVNQENLTNLPTFQPLQRVINRVYQQLQTLDQQYVNSVTSYEEIVATLEQLPIPVNTNQLFHVDAFATATGGLTTRITKQLKKTVAILNALTPDFRAQRLDQFIAAFTRRYGEREVSLLQALDQENGIAYGSATAMNPALLADLKFPAAKTFSMDFIWSPVEDWKNDRLQRALLHQEYEVVLTEADLRTIGYQGYRGLAASLPASISVVFRLLDNNKILVENAGNLGATHILGRFGQGHLGIEELLIDIAQIEQQQNPAVEFAEIAHLAKDRIGNIVQRPVTRKYEIPYLAHSGLPAERQLDLADLYLSVVGNRVFLRSRRLNRIIQPRLSSAHNFDLHAQPVYQLLCDLQTQYVKPSLRFSWGVHEKVYKFLPRLTYQDVVLTPATWRMSRVDYQHLLDLPTDQLLSTFATFCQQYRLPNLFCLAAGDNELPVKTDHLLSVQTFVATIANQERIVLTEYLVGATGVVQSEQHNSSFNNQFIVSLTKDVPTYSQSQPRYLQQPLCATAPTETTENNQPWLYYKLYTGRATADRVLAETFDYLSEAQQCNWLTDWFFIRYYDPDHHLRLRVRLSESQHRTTVDQFLRSYWAQLQEKQVIWKIQTDLYQPETHRYGSGVDLQLSEQLFYYDSQAVTQLLSTNDNPVADDLRWQWLLLSIDRWLAVWQLSVEDCIDLFTRLRTGFEQEFHANKDLRKTISQKYRTHAAGIEQWLTGQHPRTDLYAIVAQRDQNIRKTVRQLQQRNQAGLLGVHLTDLLVSHLHMMINRAIVSHSRQHELLLYNFLYRYYRMVLARPELRSTPQTVLV